MSGMDLAPYRQFAKQKLDLGFKDINLLVAAMTHRSYVNEHKKSASQHNERLEFLGDAVLELVTTRFLYDNFDEPEGILTSWRSALVRTESICQAGKELGYEPLLRMSRGEKRGSERARDHILANAFEALLGAIYLDHGYAAAEKLVSKLILSKTKQILDDKSWRDPKSHLQEVTQRLGKQTPSYRLIKSDGPDHDKIFEVGVYLGRRLLGKGIGPSKQQAQQEAAKDALRKYSG
jgi:ribonuclease-3